MTSIIAFFADPIETFKINSDTTLLLMSKAQEKNYQVAAFTTSQLFYENGQVKAQLDFIEIDTKKQPWWHITDSKTMNLSECDAIIIRKDPPFDQEYLYITYLLELLEQKGIVVSNSAKGIRDANEKLFATQFSELMPDTLVTNQSQRILDFLSKYQRIVIKPLNAMAGRCVVLVDMNNTGYKALIDLVTNMDQTKVMVQQFLPDVIEGDKRIFIINGEAIPYVVQRKPAQHDFRANLAAGGNGVVIPLSSSDQRICDILSPVLKQKNLDFVGIDVIGEQLIEVNVTSPTTIATVLNQNGFDIAEVWINMIDERLKSR